MGVVVATKITVMAWMEATAMVILDLPSIISIPAMHAHQMKEPLAGIVARLARWSVTRVSSVCHFWGTMLTSNRSRIQNPLKYTNPKNKHKMIKSRSWPPPSKTPDNSQTFAIFN